MKDVIITEAFTGYPDGKTERAFVPAAEPIGLAAPFADMIVGKGHAKWPKAAAKPKPAAKAERAKLKPARAAAPATAKEPPAKQPAPDAREADKPAAKTEGDDA